VKTYGIRRLAALGNPTLGALGDPTRRATRRSAVEGQTEEEI
jgi:hypothetical protein